MNSSGKLLAYFYALVLSVWSLAIPGGQVSFTFDSPSGQETSGETVGSVDQPESSFFLNSGVKILTGSFPADQLSHFDRFFPKAYQFVYLKGLLATVLSVLEGVEIKFRFIDVIFPFDYFW